MATVSAVQFNEMMKPYVEAGKERARQLGNRGPVRFDAKGRLAEEIIQAYQRTGFYVFEGLVDPSETALLQEEIQDLLERAPVDNGAELDKYGRPAFGREFARPVYTLIKPLSDPWGGTSALNGRHPTQMTQPESDAALPDKVVFAMEGMCQIMDAGLRLYGHPSLLAIASTINGEDFVPYMDAIFVKQPGVGGAVSWHQDGVTHWGSPNWDEGIHGFNFQVQLFDTSAQSCLWVVPGSHKLGKIDIKKMVAENGSEFLIDAVPLYANAGDVTIVNRQALHGSFVNTSLDQRVSLTIGFHRISSVIGQRAVLNEAGNGVYDEDRIDKRSRLIQIAIDARSQFYPNEPSFVYKPMAHRKEELRFTPDNWLLEVKNYNLNDLAI
ncbi:MAG TPA: phytanoyl-CoA dioxygenase family protein [Pseudomonadales bacterium]|nr:phytanoyl-CoA dioxygenase family protein [Pseudomonadales bacterium]